MGISILVICHLFTETDTPLLTLQSALPPLSTWASWHLKSLTKFSTVDSKACLGQQQRKHHCFTIMVTEFPSQCGIYFNVMTSSPINHVRNQIATRTTRTPAFWDTHRHPMITHNSDSHQIPIQNKTKSTLRNLKNCPKFKFWNFAKNLTCNTPSEVAW